MPQDPSLSNSGAGDFASAGPAEQRQVTVRTAPKYTPFLILGGVIGIIVAAFSAYGFQTPQSVSNPVRSYDPSTVFGFLAVLFAGLGVVLGALTALAFDRWGRKKATVATVQALTPQENAAVDAAGNE